MEEILKKINSLINQVRSKLTVGVMNYNGGYLVSPNYNYMIKSEQQNNEVPWLMDLKYGTYKFSLIIYNNGNVHGMVFDSIYYIFKKQDEICNISEFFRKAGKHVDEIICDIEYGPISNGKTQFLSQCYNLYQINGCIEIFINVNKKLGRIYFNECFHVFLAIIFESAKSAFLHNYLIINFLFKKCEIINITKFVEFGKKCGNGLIQYWSFKDELKSILEIFSNYDIHKINSYDTNLFYRQIISNPDFILLQICLSEFPSNLLKKFNVLNEKLLIFANSDNYENNITINLAQLLSWLPVLSVDIVNVIQELLNGIIKSQTIDNKLLTSIVQLLHINPFYIKLIDRYGLFFEYLNRANVKKIFQKLRESSAVLETQVNMSNINREETNSYLFFQNHYNINIIKLIIAIKCNDINIRTNFVYMMFIKNSEYLKRSLCDIMSVGELSIVPILVAIDGRFSHWVAFFIKDDIKIYVDPLGNDVPDIILSGNVEKLFDTDNHPQIIDHSEDETYIFNDGPFLVETLRRLAKGQEVDTIRKDMARNNIDESNEYGNQLRAEHLRLLSNDQRFETTDSASPPFPDADDEEDEAEDQSYTQNYGLHP